MTKNWIEMFKKAPAAVQLACRRAMQKKTTIKFETERLGEQIFEHPPKFKDIMYQFKEQGGNYASIEGV